MGLISYLTTVRFDFGAISGVGQDLTTSASAGR